MRTPAAVANELGNITANVSVTPTTAHKQVTTADGLVTATTFPIRIPNVLPDPEDEAQGMSVASIMETTSAVSNEHVSSRSSGSLRCRPRLLTT